MDRTRAVLRGPALNRATVRDLSCPVQHIHEPRKYIAQRSAGTNKLACDSLLCVMSAQNATPMGVKDEQST